MNPPVSLRFLLIFPDQFLIGSFLFVLIRVSSLFRFPQLGGVVCPAYGLFWLMGLGFLVPFVVFSQEDCIETLELKM